MTTTVTIDAREVLDLLGQLQGSLTNLRLVMKDVGATLVSAIHQQLGQGVTPWGQPMEPLKTRCGVPLNDTGQHIYNRITYRDRPTLLAQTVYVGTLGLLFVIPVVIGAYSGRWIDGWQEGYSMRWTLSLISIGIVVGGFNVYLFIKE